VNIEPLNLRFIEIPSDRGKWLIGKTNDFRVYYENIQKINEPGYYESAGYSNSADPWKEERFD
jgi:hypothetical protein